MQHTEYSYLTDEEVINKVETKTNPTSLEVELASRLQDAIDGIEEAEEIVEGLCDLLDENGIAIEFVEGMVQ
jgi:hypothetical protein